MHCCQRVCVLDALFQEVCIWSLSPGTAMWQLEYNHTADDVLLGALCKEKKVDTLRNNKKGHRNSKLMLFKLHVLKGNVTVQKNIKLCNNLCTVDPSSQTNRWLPLTSSCPTQPCLNVIVVVVLHMQYFHVKRCE